MQIQAKVNRKQDTVFINLHKDTINKFRYNKTWFTTLIVTAKNTVSNFYWRDKEQKWYVKETKKDIDDMIDDLY